MLDLGLEGLGQLAVMVELDLDLGFMMMALHPAVSHLFRYCR